MQEWTLCLSVGPYIALFPTHLRGEEDGPGVLEEDEEVAGLVGGREERDEVGHAEQRDDDEERLGRLQVLVVLRLGVVRPQLATHHLRREQKERGCRSLRHSIHLGNALLQPPQCLSGTHGHAYSSEWRQLFG